MPTPDSRHEQRFPKLTPDEIDRMRRFGSSRSYAAGEALVVAGQISAGMFVLVAGAVAITRRDPFGHFAPIVETGPGDFVAEIVQLTGGPALVDATAVTEVEALVVPREGLRALLVAEAELGERIMRALILRRVALIETGAVGPVLIGSAASPDVVRLQGFLTRNGYPHQLLDPTEDRDAAAMIERYAPQPDELPLVVCANGEILKNPHEVALARCIGMVQTEALDRVYDVAIVGAGPAGLATAVYAASEGLSVVVLDARAFGGQAGASARIENYLGFPTGISGQALTGRAYVQAQKFGVEMLIPSEVAGLDCSGGPLALTLTCGGEIRAATVVIASGARYRRPDIPRLPTFEGRGVWYWASPIEARMCRQEEIVLVGGGNSAGQAAVFLSGFAAKVHMLVRGPDLAATMSRYLVDRIAAAPNIELITHSEIVALSGTAQGQLEHVRWRNRATGVETEKAIRNLFLFVGAEPATTWLKGCGVALDGHGFVRTGASCGRDDEAVDGRPQRPLPLESSIPGVFAVGDARAGSIKRVGAAIGEGAAAVAQLHAVLAEAVRVG